MPFSPGLTNQPFFNMASTAVMLTLCLCNRAALRLAKRDPDSVSRPPSNRHARLTPPPPPPHDESTLQLVTSPLNSCNLFEPWWVVGGGNTRNPCRRAASTCIRHSSIHHGITSPFALALSLLPSLPTQHALGSEICPRAASVLQQYSCCMAQTLLAIRKSLTRGQPYGTFSRRSNSLHDAGVVPSSPEPLRPCSALCKLCIMVQLAEAANGAGAVLR